MFGKRYKFEFLLRSQLHLLTITVRSSGAMIDFKISTVGIKGKIFGRGTYKDKSQKIQFLQRIEGLVVDSSRLCRTSFEVGPRSIAGFGYRKN